jgi:tetratricopeptide (TPR) repeat protein
MLFNWLDARQATEVGTSLADDFVLQSAAAGQGRKGARAGSQDNDLQKFLQRFLQRVDRDARPLQLNVFKRAKLANSFKWRLLEKGIERQLVDELTQALVLRLTNRQGGEAVADKPAPSGSKRRAGSHEAQTLHSRGNEAMARGAFADALDCYRELVDRDPRDAAARTGMGMALAQLARYGEAEGEFRRAVGLRPNSPEAQFHLGWVLQLAGRHNDSEDPFRRALKLKPSYVEARVSLGMSFVLLGRLREARDCYEKALRAAPRDTRAMVGVGQIDALEGQFGEAEARYRRAVELSPKEPYAWAAMAWLRKMTPADADWFKRAEEIAASGLTPIEEAAVRFAVGKYCDDVGDFGRAFRSFERANELHKLRAEPYERELRTRFVDDLIRVYTPETLARARAGASDSSRPVFVVGMPRSGTSLVEQILASHPTANGAGELNFWTVVMRKYEGAIRQEVPAEGLRRKLATDYLRVLEGHSADALRVVDKAPVNADYLGLINAVFPNARIIYLRRDPIDTCLSCYFQQFPPAMNYTMDLSDLAHYYREHRRLAAHWRAVLPPEVLLEVPYADLVADQETWTRRILEFVGLPWDERCLEFHKTARAVTTASTWQVRQKIYKSSVERWRNYEKFIGPLLSLRNS